MKKIILEEDNPTDLHYEFCVYKYKNKFGPWICCCNFLEEYEKWRKKK